MISFNPHNNLRSCCYCHPHFIGEKLRLRNCHSFSGSHSKWYSENLNPGSLASEPQLLMYGNKNSLLSPNAYISLMSFPNYLTIQTGLNFSQIYFFSCIVHLEWMCHCLYSQLWNHWKLLSLTHSSQSSQSQKTLAC